MKRLFIALTTVTLLAAGALAYAHGPGFGGGYMGQYGGHMMGTGPGERHMGPGYGGHMMGPEGVIEGEAGRKFFDETYELRKKMHDKRFELREALRNPDTTLETVAKLEREIQGLKENIREKAPEEAQKRFGGYGGYGGCWQ
jgi:hypothetical protein